MHLERAQEVVDARRSTPIEAPREIAQVEKPAIAEKNKDNKTCKSRDSRRSLEASKKKGKSPDQRVPRPLPSKYNNFIDLTKSHEDVFFVTEHTGVYKWPNSMLEDR